MELTPHAQVFDRAAATYDRVGVEFFSALGRRLVQEAAVAPGESVLDIGTGRGAVLAPAAEAVGPTGRVVGVDLAPSMVALTAAEHARSAHVEVRQADAAHLPADLGTFDAVLSSLVLFFCDDPGAVLARWAGHVAPGGRLGLVTFVEDQRPDWFADLLRRWLPPRPGDDGGDAAGPGPEPSPFELVRDPDWLDDALRTAGLGEITAIALDREVRFADVERWWAWAWSHGGRAALEQLDPADHDAVKADAAAQLDAHRLPDGALGISMAVRITLARTAG